MSYSQGNQHGLVHDSVSPAGCASLAWAPCVYSSVQRTLHPEDWNPCVDYTMSILCCVIPGMSAGKYTSTHLFELPGSRPAASAEDTGCKQRHKSAWAGVACAGLLEWHRWDMRRHYQLYSITGRPPPDRETVRPEPSGGIDREEYCAACCCMPCALAQLAAEFKVCHCNKHDSCHSSFNNSCQVYRGWFVIYVLAVCCMGACY